MGTPCEVYKEEGAKVWHYEQSTYGGTEVITGDLNFIPFRYQGQYEDAETGLYYNRFRYYSPEEESYISQDPIRLNSGEFNFYNYVHDSNNYVDVFGLECKVNAVITETNAGKGNLTSIHTLTHDEALEAGIRFVGKDAKEIGKSGSGVYRSQHLNKDGTVNQFRMDGNSVQGNHSPNVPHVHLEIIDLTKNKPVVNNHIPIN